MTVRSTPTSSIVLAPGARTIVAGECFVIAEAGVNHDGDPGVAAALIDAAADAGADAVKFQTFDPTLVVHADAPKARYQAAAMQGTETQLSMLSRLVLPRSAHADLMAHAATRGILFLSTPFDEPSADFLAALGVPAFKVASGEVTNHGLLAHIARHRKPILMSSGMSNTDELYAALQVLRQSGDPSVALLHCVSSYPAPPDECNLRAIESMQREFNCLVGWSDHTLGIDIAIAAVACGAAVLEKHLTLNRQGAGPDHAASLEPSEFREMVASVRRVTAALGDGVKRPVPSEMELRVLARRSLVARRDIAAGQVLSPDDLVALRPATGMAPSEAPAVVGKIARIPITAGTLLAAEYFA